MSGVSDHWLDDILSWFNSLENDLSGISRLVFEIVIGKIPDSKIDSVYALAEAWETAAARLAEIQSEVGELAQPILEDWRGDTAAAQFSQQWFSYQQALGNGVQSVSRMAQGVREFGLQVELLKFMVALNLVILALQILYALVMAFFSGGLSVGAVVPMVQATGRTIAMLATRTATAIASIAMRVSLRNLPRILPRALPTLARTGAPALTRAGLPTLVRTQLPTLVRTQLPNLVRTQLPNLVRTQGSNLIRTQLPNLVRTSLPVLGRGAMNVARNVPSHLARNFLPKNVIARVVANRMANQWMRSMATRQLLRGLARQAGAQALTRSSLVSARNALAWQIEQQLLRKFSTNVATNFVERGAANALTRMAEGGLARQLTSQTLGQHATRMVAQVSFGRELARYMIPRVALGAAFMGGGNLVGQLLQIAEGHRTSLDWGQVGMYTGQGVLFGAALWGGVPGQAVGGGLASGAWAAGVEAYDYLTSDDPERRAFDWGEVAYQAAHGAVSGAAFGLVDHVQMSRVNVPLRIGQEVGAMPHPRVERPVLLIRDSNSNTYMMLDRDSGALLRQGGGDPVWIDRQGNQIDISRLGFRTDSGDPSPGRPDEPPAPQRLFLGELAPGDTLSPDRPPVGTDGGPSQQAASQTSSPAVPRLPEGGQTATPEPVRQAGPPDQPPPSSATSTPDGPPRRVDHVPPDGTPAVPERGPAPERGVVPERGPTPERGVAPEGGPGPERGLVPERGPTPERGPAPERGVVPERGPEHGSPAERGPTPERTGPERASSADERLVDPTGQPHALLERTPGDRTPGQPPAEHGPLPRERGGPETPTTSERAPAHEGPPIRERTAAEPDGPPPPESRSPDGQQSEAPRREAEQAMWSAGAEPGEPPTPRSIEQGTVRMEEHPDFPAVVREFEERGFTMHPTTGDPHIWVRHVVDAQGNVLRVEREVHVRPGMRFLDLEHELGHARQVTDPRRYPPERYPHGSLPDEYVHETPEGERRKARVHGPKVKKFQYAAHEYHVRMEEYLRLAERGVDPPILQEHARGVDEHRQEHYQQLRKGSYSEDREGWVRAHFPDIPELERRVAEVRAADAGTTRPPADPPSRGDAGQGMYKRSGEPGDGHPPEAGGGEAGGRPGRGARPGALGRVWEFWRRLLLGEGSEGTVIGETAQREPGGGAPPGAGQASQAPRPPGAGALFGPEQQQSSHPTSGTFESAWPAPPHQEGLGVPVIGADQVSFQRTPPPDPPAPPPLTPDWVRQALDDPTTPAGQRQLILRHLAEPEGPHQFVPRSQAEIDQTLARFNEEAGAAVQQPPPAHQYGPEGEPPRPAEPWGEGPGDRPLTPEEYWSDPPWRREQRQPSLDELIPSSHREAEQLADVIREEIAAQFRDLEFAGMRLRLRYDELSNSSISVYKDSVTVRLQIYHPEHGLVGETVRSFNRDYDGQLYVEHVSLHLSESMQGKGFAKAWNRHLLEWYEYSGVERIEVHAASKVGGFAWAWEGFDWAPNTEHRAQEVFKRLRMEMNAVDEALAQLDRWRAGDQSVNIDQLRERYRVDDPDTLETELRRQRDAAAEVLERARRYRFGSDGYPTPYEVAAAGWNGQHGKEATWIGKRAMLGSNWKGVKPVSDAGPQFTRPRVAGDEPSDPYGGGQPPGRITAEEMPGFPGHGGPREPDANLGAAHAAARNLASEHPDLPGNGYQLRWETDPVHGDLLVAEVPDRRLPAVALRFTVGEVPEGRVAFTEPTSQRTAGGVPVFETTISDSIPVADRELVTRRAVAHEVGELLEELRPRGFAERWQGLVGGASDRPFDPHEVGMLTELRLELSDGQPPDTAAASARDRRLGHLLDRLAAQHRLDQIVSYLESFGHHADLDYVRSLAEPTALWRGEADAARRVEGLSALAQALIRLSGEDVGLLAHGQVLPDGTMARVGVPGPGGRIEIVDVPVATVLDELARSGSVGERLHVEAVTKLVGRVAEQFGGQLGRLWGEGRDLATARVLVSLLDALPAEQLPEYRRALPAVLDRLGADQLAALRDGPVPEPLRRDLLDRQVSAVLRETLAGLTGEAPGRLVSGTDWRPDGGLALTGHDGRVRQVPGEVLDRVEGWLRGRIVGGADLPTVRAELAAVLATQLDPYTGAPGRSPINRVLGALGELWTDPDQPGGVRAAVEAVAGELLSGHELRAADLRALPEPARQLVETAPPVPRHPGAVDPYASLRPSRWSDVVAEIDRRVHDLADAPAVDRDGRVAAAADPVRRVADTLTKASSELDGMAKAKRDGAQKQQREATDKVEKATRERAQSDRWAQRRYEDALAEAERTKAVVDRHLERAKAYQRVGELARTARDRFRELADELAALPAAADGQWRSRVSEVVARAEAARQAYESYRAELAELQPRALDNAVPVRRLPHLNALATRATTMLAQLGIDHQVRPEDLQRELLSMWRWVAGDDGAVITVADGAAELLVRFRHRDAVEVVNPPETGAELALAQLPQFPQGSRVRGVAMHRTWGVNVAPDLTPVVAQLGEMLPDIDVPANGWEAAVTAVRTALRHAILRFNLRYGPRWSVTGEGAEFALPGGVFAVKGDLPLFDIDGSWEVQARRSGTDEWSVAATLDRGGDGDRTGLQALVPHSYAESAPKEPYTTDRPPVDRFPEHAVTMSGTDRLQSLTLRLFEQAGGEVSDPVRQAVRTLIHQEFPARLEQAVNNPGGWHRDIRVDGKPVAIVRIKTTVDRDSVRMLGGPSDQAPLEKLRVGIAQATGSTVVTHAKGGGIAAGGKLLPADPNEPSPFGFAPGVSGGSATSDGLSVARVAIHPNVQRFVGHTQGYEIGLTHEVVVQVLDGDRARDVATGSGLFRFSEPDAFRYGLPVDPAAVLRGEHKVPLRDEQGWEVLRGDPRPGPPAGRVGAFPEWLGPRGIGGAGPANVGHLTGVDELRMQLEQRLRQDGWLPPLDAEGFPILSDSELERLGQLDNLREIAELNASRLETDYDQAAQQGIVLDLVRHRSNHAPEHLTLRVRLFQQEPELIGHTRAEAVVNLDIGRQVITRTGGETRDWSIGGGPAGAHPIGGGGFEGSWQPRKVTSGWQVGEAVHQGTLVESNGPTAVFRVPHMLEVREVGGNAEHGPLLAGGGLDGVGAGEARVVLPGDLLPEADPAQSPPVPRPAPPISPRVLSELMVVHVDAGRLPDAVRLVLPDGARAGSPGYVHAAAFTNVRNMVAAPTWLFSDYRTDHVVDPRGLTPLRSTLTVRGELRDLTFVTAASLVSSDVNFTMGVQSVTTGHEKRFSFGGDGALLALTGGYDRASGSAISVNAEQILGRERLAPFSGVHYVFAGVADQTVIGTEHHPTLHGGPKTRTEPLPNVRLAAIMPESTALALYADGELLLPLAQVEDALSRHRAGHLHLDALIAEGVEQRYRADRALVEQAEKAASQPEAPDAAGATARDGSATTAPAPKPPAPRQAPDAAGWQLPEHLRDALGQGGAELVYLVDPEGRPITPVALADEVLRHVEQVAPNATERLPGLHQSLTGQFAGRSWSGKLDQMLGPEGWTFDLSVPVGRYGVERLTVRIKADFLETDTGGQGWRVGQAPDLGSILQDYGYEQSTSRQQRSSSHAFSGGYRHVLGDVDAPDWAGSGSRGRGGASWSSEQITAVQRLSSFNGVDRFERPIKLMVSVTREFEHPVRDLPVRVYERFKGGRPESSGEIVGAVVQRVPDGLLRQAGSEQATVANPPPTSPLSRLPDRYVAESVDLGDVPSVMRELLEQRGLLGRDGVARHRDMINRAVSQLAADPGLAWMHTRGGHTLLRLPRPDHPGEMVQVLIEAEPTGQRVVTPPRPGVQLGHDTRSQHLVGERDEHDRLFPATRDVNDEQEVLGGGTVGHTKGESASESNQLVIGDRDEHKAWQEGKGTTVKVDLRFRVSAVLSVMSPDGTFTDTSMGSALAKGNAYLTVYESERDGPTTRPGAGRWRIGEVPAVPAPARTSRLPAWLGGSSTTPTVALGAMLTDVAARPGFTPADAPTAIADRLARDLGRQWQAAQVLHLDAAGAGAHGVDPLAVAAEVASRRGGEVLIDVHGADGTLWPYRVLPDGGMHPAFPDGGYAAARAGLPEGLTAQADRAGLDLRRLYQESTRTGRPFADVVAEAVGPAADGRQGSSGQAPEATEGPFRKESQLAPGGQDGPPVSVDQVKMALGRAGMSVADYDIVYVPTIEAEAGMPIYGRSSHVDGKPLPGPRGRPLIEISELGLSSMKEAVVTIFHEIYHHMSYVQRGEPGRESDAEAYGQRMWEKFERNSRRAR